MRWEALFGDMEAQLAAAASLDVESEITERVRMELVSVTLQDRLRRQQGKRLVLDMGTAGILQGDLRYVGQGWIALDDGGRSVLAVLRHVVSIRGLDRFSAPAPETVQLGLASALRSIARDRAAVTIRSAGAAAGNAVHGIIDRVGADFLEVAAVASGQPRRAGNVSGVYVLPTASVSAVLSREGGWD